MSRIKKMKLQIKEQYEKNYRWTILAHIIFKSFTSSRIQDKFAFCWMFLNWFANTYTNGPCALYLKYHLKIHPPNFSGTICWRKIKGLYWLAIKFHKLLWWMRSWFLCQHNCWQYLSRVRYKILIFLSGHHQTDRWKK